MHNTWHNYSTLFRQQKSYKQWHLAQRSRAKRLTRTTFGFCNNKNSQLLSCWALLLVSTFSRFILLNTSVKLSSWCIIWYPFWRRIKVAWRNAIMSANNYSAVPWRRCSLTTNRSSVQCTPSRRHSCRPRDVDANRLIFRLNNVGRCCIQEYKSLPRQTNPQ